MMNIHVHTQYAENYGDAEKPHWKYKGGSTTVLTGFDHPLNDQIGAAAKVVVEKFREKIEYHNDMSEEYIIDWEFYPVDELTRDEKEQLEYDGEIRYPSTRISINDQN